MREQKDEMQCGLNITDELKEKIKDVRIDNFGKKHGTVISAEELTEELEVLNPDDDSRGRG